MKYFDEELYRLQQQILIKNQLESELENLDKQQKELHLKVRELEKRKWSEEADVERLEGRSLASFFYRITGKKDEILSKEREEAYSAALKYDAAMAELGVVEKEIDLHRKKCQVYETVRNSMKKFKKINWDI